MRLIHATYNAKYNSIDINHYEGYILRLDCNKAENGIITTACSRHSLDVLALDNPLEYVRLVLDCEIQEWINAEDDLYF